MRDINRSIILDCDFCSTIKGFENMQDAIEKGWNWQEGETDYGYIVSAGCPDHDAGKVVDLFEEKREELEMVESEEDFRPEDQRSLSEVAE